MPNVVLPEHAIALCHTCDVFIFIAAMEGTDS